MRLLFVLCLASLCAPCGEPRRYSPHRFPSGFETYPLCTQPLLAKGQAYLDPVYRSIVRRMTDWGADGLRGHGDGIATGYPTWNPENSDGRYLVLMLFDAASGGSAGYAVYKTDDWSVRRDLSWLGSFNGQDPEPRWDRSGTYPARLYYRRDKQLRFYDVDSGEQGLVHDFGVEFPEPGFYIYNGEEGSPSADSRHWAFLLRNESAPYQTTRLIHFDMATGQVNSKPLSSGPDFVTVSPDGTCILASYYWTGQGGEYDGPHTYSLDFLHNWHVGNDVRHWGWAYLDDGSLVYYWQDWQDWLTNSKTDARGPEDWVPFFNYGLTRSYPAIHGALMPPPVRGWAFGIFKAEGSDWAAGQIIAFRLRRDSNAILRVGRIQDRSAEYGHGHGQISHDGRFYYFGSDNCGTAPMDVYRLEFPAGWWFTPREPERPSLR